MTVKERPILFSAPMVRAILEGRKTQTRRIAKLNHAGRVSLGGRNWHISDPEAVLACPYGKPGDRLWVKETFATDHCVACDHSDLNPLPSSHTCKTVFYRADNERSIVWRPSIFMPRWASRITLEVTGVRVERLNSISAPDAMAEGIDLSHQHDSHVQANKIYAYRKLWESINGAESWAVNPWVWVIEFKRITGGAK